MTNETISETFFIEYKQEPVDDWAVWGYGTWSWHRHEFRSCLEAIARLREEIRVNPAGIAPAAIRVIREVRTEVDCGALTAEISPKPSDTKP